MNYAIINNTEYIENIIGKLGLPQDNQRILTGHMITRLDKCYEMLVTMDTTSSSDVEVLRRTSQYMKKKGIPFAITEERNSRYNHFYVHGKEITRTKSESKKITR